jgi:hypothetical protein
MAYPVGADSPRFVQGVRTRADGLFMELDSRNIIDWSLVFLGEYEVHLGQLFQDVLAAGEVAIDIGANIGVHTLRIPRIVISPSTPS